MALLLLLGVDAADFFATLRDAVSCLDDGATLAALAELLAVLTFYAVRHAAVYIAAVKFVLDYSGTIFERLPGDPNEP